jgi:hypothetical protein
MKACHTKIIINKSVSKVWEVLTDISYYPKWNPLIGNIRGEMKEGNMVLAYVVPLKGSFPVRIISYKAEQEIIWQGTLLNQSIIVGEHYYKLKDIGNDQTELLHGETFTGALANLMPQSLLSSMQDAYEYHNQKLKIIVESSAN